MKSTNHSEKNCGTPDPLLQLILAGETCEDRIVTLRGWANVSPHSDRSYWLNDLAAYLAEHVIIPTYACGYTEPYGFVPEAGCPIHDREQPKMLCQICKIHIIEPTVMKNGKLCYKCPMGHGWYE